MAVASIAGIKRVSIEALVNGNMTKADAAANVRRIAGRARPGRLLLRRDRRRPLNPAVQVVWTFVFRTAGERVQPVARWLSVDAPANAQPAYDEQERSV